MFFTLGHKKTHDDLLAQRQVHKYEGETIFRSLDAAKRWREEHGFSQYRIYGVRASESQVEWYADTAGSLLEDALIVQLASEDYPGDIELRAGRTVCFKPLAARDPRVCHLGDSEKRLITPACTKVLDVKPSADIAIIGHHSLITGADERWCVPCELLRVAPRHEDMTDAEYVYGLRVMRALIADGLPLHKWDDTTIGDKETYVSWGMTNDLNPLRKPERPHVWPYGMPRRQDRHSCPLDMDPLRGRDGCFYHCAAFKTQLTRERALWLYDQALARFRYFHEDNDERLD